MRYWHPYTEEAIAQLTQDNIDKLVILPLTRNFPSALAVLVFGY
jgi:ferrochelatase